MSGSMHVAQTSRPTLLIFFRYRPARQKRVRLVVNLDAIRSEAPASEPSGAWHEKLADDVLGVLVDVANVAH
jgi:hypothetical protein